MDFIRFQDSDTLSRSGLILEPDTSTLEHKTAILQSTQTIGFKYRFEFSISYSRFLRIKNIESIDYVFLILDSYQNSFFFIRNGTPSITIYTFFQFSLSFFIRHSSFLEESQVIKQVDHF